MFTRLWGRKRRRRGRVLWVLATFLARGLTQDAAHYCVDGDLHISVVCVYFTLSYILSPGAVSDVAARRQDKLPTACVHFLYGRKGRAAGWAQTIQLAPILSAHTFILSRPHMLNSQCVGTKEGAMAWSNTAVWYSGETSCNSLCQSARGSCFQAEEAVIHNEQRKWFCV